MSEDMPWVIGLTDEEVQELRKNKQELTQYGKEKIRQLMNHEEMLEEAERREAIVAKVSEDDYQKVLDATKTAMDNYKPEPPKPLSEMTREERVEAGIQEIWWIVQGGQDGREYADSIAFVIQVLDSLR